VNDALDTKQEVLRPGVSPSGDIVWVCQDGEVPALADATMADAVVIPADDKAPGKYLPATCRA
jgi:hypothetical protein